MSPMLGWDESFSMQANVTSPGYQRIALRGFITERRADGLYAAPLIPQLFYGADGTQLTSWRQYLPQAGSQTILSRSAGLPRVPREELFWRRIGDAVGARVGAYSVGRRIPGSLRPLSQMALAGETESGEFYELHIDTDGISDPREVVEALVGGLGSRGVETVWVSADAERIRIQIAGSPIAWAVLIPFIPVILAAVGVAVIFIAVFQIFGAIPGWAWGLLAIGLLLIFAVPALVRFPEAG